MAAPDEELIASLERNFTMEAQTTASNSTQSGLFIGEYKNFSLSGVTSVSFKEEGRNRSQKHIKGNNSMSEYAERGNHYSISSSNCFLVLPTVT